MNEAARSQIMAPAVAIGLALVSAISLIAYLALSAYAPEFRTESDGGAHALSKSAIGFAGLRILLDEMGTESVIARTTTRTAPGLLVLTPGPQNTAAEIAKLSLSGPSLIILPKWWPIPDPVSYGRVLKGFPVSTAQTGRLLDLLAKGTTVKQRHDRSVPQWVAPAGAPVRIPAQPDMLDSLQTISGKAWIPIIEDRRGGTVLARLPGLPVYVLADPDLLNNHGLASLSRAALSLQIIDTLRRGDTPVAFDVTLNGLGQPPSILRALFAPPFLGATVCAILAAMLIGVHAAVRFGSPSRTAPIFASGKRALASNAAGMIRMLNREPAMAARYAMACENVVLRSLGIRRSETGFAGFDRSHADAYKSLLVMAEQVSDREELMAVARRLYEWREGEHA